MGKALPAPRPQPGLPLPSSPTTAKAGLDMVVQAFADYKKVVEVERTRRELIAARREVELERIRSQRHLLEGYLQQVFAERRDIIAGLFERLDQGLDSGNDALIQQCLGGIVAVASQSPLKDAHDLMRAMDDPQVQVIDI